MRTKLVILAFLGSPAVYASSPAEELILLCKGGMNTKDVVEVTGEVEGRILELARSKVDGEGRVKQEGTISQFDLIKAVKGGVTEGLYKFDITSYYACVEKMGPMVLGAKVRISNSEIEISKGPDSGLIKSEIKLTQDDAYKLAIQYVRQEEDKVVIAMNFHNNRPSSSMDLEYAEKTAKLIGEDTGEEYELLSIDGLPKSNTHKVEIGPLASKLVKFTFKKPESSESVKFSSSWPSYGNLYQIGIAITMKVAPLNISWLDVNTNNYNYKGPLSEQ